MPDKLFPTVTNTDDMGKTRAEIQKAYRERKKLEMGEEYRNETERVKKYNIAIDALTRRRFNKKKERKRMDKKI